MTLDNAPERGYNEGMTTLDIYITGLAEAKAINHHFDSVLSVLSEGYLNFTHKDHLYVPMDDTANPTWHGSPTVDMARSILDWAQPRIADDHGILIHCYAGMSRSTASAIGICALAGMTEDEAWDHVFLSRPDIERDFIPNPLLLSHFDKLLGTNLISRSDRSWELKPHLGWTTR